MPGKVKMAGMPLPLRTGNKLRMPVPGLSREPVCLNGAWQLKDGEWLLPGAPFGLMGILNLTPDSFYDGGRNLADGRYMPRVGEMLSAGADIIDLGAESTRPGALPLSPDSEQKNLMPALVALSGKYPDAVFSIDTYHAGTAALALEAGAQIINDISACRHDPGLEDVLVQYRPGYVLMHSGDSPPDMQANPQYENVIDDLLDFFETNLSRLVRRGLPEACIVLDPGIGFGKNLAHNLSIFQNIERFKIFGRPLLLGLSMKSFLGSLLEIPLAERGPATMLATALMWKKGVFWHRVHDVSGAAAGLSLACSLQ